jgi:hypothetical protein
MSQERPNCRAAESCQSPVTTQLEDEVATDFISPVGQTLTQACIAHVSTTADADKDIADPRYGRLLRPRRERPYSYAAANQRDEIPSPHKAPLIPASILPHQTGAVVQHSDWRARNVEIGHQLPRGQQVGAVARPPTMVAQRTVGAAEIGQ